MNFSGGLEFIWASHADVSEHSWKPNKRMSSTHFLDNQLIQVYSRALTKELLEVRVSCSYSGTHMHLPIGVFRKWEIRVQDERLCQQCKLQSQERRLHLIHKRSFEWLLQAPDFDCADRSSCWIFEHKKGYWCSLLQIPAQGFASFLLFESDYEFKQLGCKCSPNQARGLLSPYAITGCSTDIPSNAEFSVFVRVNLLQLRQRPWEDNNPVFAGTLSERRGYSGGDCCCHWI